MAGLNDGVTRADIERLEELSFNAWPALHTERRDGWVLRFTDGFTKRANSANAMHAAGSGLAGLVADVEAAYRARALRPIFRLTPLAPPEADGLLAARGYALLDPSLVMRASLADTGAAPADPGIEIAARPGAAWLDGYARASALLPPATGTLARMLARIPAPTGYARLALDGADAAFGFAAVEGDHVGLFDIVTVAAQRRRGHGRRLVGALLAWARVQGARHAYLQVVAANAAARQLYESLGFTPAYAYHYRVAPG